MSEETKREVRIRKPDGGGRLGEASLPGEREGIALRKIGSLAEYERVTAAAAADNHRHMQSVTHYATKDGEIVGAMCIGGASLTHAWLHTTKMRGRYTKRAFELVEGELKRLGYGVSIVPVDKSSPLHRQMAKHFGYTNLGTTDLFGKSLKV
jgi:hypothetical protein